MKNFVNKIMGDLEGKKEWKAMEARAKALPEEYRIVYKEIKQYVWMGGAGAVNPTNSFEHLLKLLEEGAASGKHVLEVTGKDVAAFADKLMHGEKSYAESLRDKLNSAIAKKLGK